MQSFLKLLMSAILIFNCSPVMATNFPLKVRNCGSVETFQQPPKTVVTIGQHETELMLSLGLGNKIAGTAVWFGQLPPELEPSGKNLIRIANNAPGFEAVAARNPDLVMAQYSWHVGPQGEVASRHQFEQLGIKTWISPADCEGKSVTATSNGDGARTTPYSLNAIYEEITQLAQIFDVTLRGEQLKNTLAQRVTHAQKQAARLSTKPLKIVYWFSSTRLQGDPWIAGNMGAPGWITRSLGMKNIIDSSEEWPSVTWEHIVKSQPDIIVIASMDRRLYPADDATVKKAFLERDPVTREMNAVKQGHIVVVPAMSLNPSLRNVDALEQISQQVAAFK
ncbi:ABC transporter substrate-binding protein (plasmid) [Erwinia rhapontici]|uniref:ABC transporter substrate-binding protein n=1 Tax=Erwinia rhapontici TaxID=55212 RepID=UPI001BB361AD|nr:ABC transporter substrate-binding protein [Erwinia rhapontici]